MYQVVITIEGDADLYYFSTEWEAREFVREEKESFPGLQTYEIYKVERVD